MSDEKTVRPSLAVRLLDGSLARIDTILCSGCQAPMPDVESGEMCWSVPGRGVFHGDCYSPNSE